MPACPNQSDGDARVADDVPVLRRAAMDCLARREHSRFELLQKLQQRFPDQSPDLIRQVLTQLQEENLQSDARFVESYVRYRKSRGFGYLHIKAELQARQVAPALVDQYLIADDDDWLAIAAELMERKVGDGGVIVFASKEHRKLLRFLQSRGFTGRQIRQVVDPRLGRRPAEAALPD